MIEQKVIIDLKNDMGGVGTLYISGPGRQVDHVAVGREHEH